MHAMHTNLNPNVRNGHSTRTPGSIPVRLLRRSLLKNICRVQAESDGKLPYVCESAHSQPHSALPQKHLYALTGRGEWKAPLGGPGFPKSRIQGSVRTRMVPDCSTYELPTGGSMRNLSPKSCKGRAHLWSETLSQQQSSPVVGCTREAKSFPQRLPLL